MVKLCTIPPLKKTHGDNPTAHLQAPVYAQGEQANIQNLGVTMFPPNKSSPHATGRKRVTQLFPQTCRARSQKLFVKPKGTGSI